MRLETKMVPLVYFVTPLLLMMITLSCHAMLECDDDEMAEWRPIKIKIKYMDNELYEEKVQYKALKNAALKTTQFFEKLVKVKEKKISKLIVPNKCIERVNRIREQLNLSRNRSKILPKNDNHSCHSNPNDTEDKSIKIFEDSDFGIFLFVIKKRDLQAIATSGPFKSDNNADRPVTCIIVFNWIFLEKSSGSEDDLVHPIFQALIHEFFHCLFFFRGLYKYFRYENGTAYFPSKVRESETEDYKKLLTEAGIIKLVTRPWLNDNAVNTVESILLGTPNVRKVVRTILNCDELFGAEMKDLEPRFETTISHWSTRIFYPEIMVSTINTFEKMATLSSLTLALMKDTGWYRINESMAESLHLLGKPGCAFASKTCQYEKLVKEGEDWLKYSVMTKDQTCLLYPKDLYPDLKTSFCSTQKEAIAQCDNSQKINDTHQYDETIKLLGGTEDKCPLTDLFNPETLNTIGKSRFYMCNETKNVKPNNIAMETFGKETMCFEQSVKWSRKNSLNVSQFQEYFGAGCYKYRCTKDGFYAEINGESYPCQSGKKINVITTIDEWTYTGGIVCPVFTISDKRQMCCIS